MTEPLTIDKMLTRLKEVTEQKEVIAPSKWIDIANKLNALLGSEHDILFDLQQKVAQLKVDCITRGDSAAAAKMKVEASLEHKEAQKQKAKIERVEEFIRIAKIQARLRETELKGY
jgi:hypothetical protein